MEIVCSVELTKKNGLDEVNVENVEEIAQETAAKLSNDELKELMTKKKTNILIAVISKKSKKHFWSRW